MYKYTIRYGYVFVAREKKSTRWTSPSEEKKSHPELKIFSGDIHFPEEADKVLGGYLIPPKRQKRR
jgi:hypothetical protein